MSSTRSKKPSPRRSETSTTTAQAQPEAGAAPALNAPQQVEVMPTRPLASNVLFCDVDKLNALSFDSSAGTLTISFQIPAVSAAGPLDNFSLRSLNGSKHFSLQPRRNVSPGLGQRWPELAWASESRFVFNESIELGASAERIYSIVAEVAGESVRLACILMTGTPIRVELKTAESPVKKAP